MAERWRNVAVRESDYEMLSEIRDGLGMQIGRILHDCIVSYYDLSYRPVLEAIRSGQSDVSVRIHVSDAVRRQIAESKTP